MIACQAGLSIDIINNLFFTLLVLFFCSSKKYPTLAPHSSYCILVCFVLSPIPTSKWPDRYYCSFMSGLITGCVCIVM